MSGHRAKDNAIEASRDLIRGRSDKGIRLPEFVDAINARWERVHLNPSRAELVEAIAYLAAQLVGNERRNLASRQLEASWVDVTCAVDRWRLAVVEATAETDTQIPPPVRLLPAHLDDRRDPLADELGLA